MGWITNKTSKLSKKTNKSMKKPLPIYKNKWIRLSLNSNRGFKKLTKCKVKIEVQRLISTTISANVALRYHALNKKSLMQMTIFRN